jgi:hypothetical protein
MGQAVVPGESPPVKDHPQETEPETSPGDQRGHETDQRLAPGHFDGRLTHQAKPPGAHAEGLAAVDPETGEETEADQREVGLDGGPHPGQSADGVRDQCQWYGRNEKHGEQQQRVVGDSREATCQAGGPEIRPLSVNALEWRAHSQETPNPRIFRANLCTGRKKRRFDNDLRTLWSIRKC